MEYGKLARPEERQHEQQNQWGYPDQMPIPARSTMSMPLLWKLGMMIHLRLVEPEGV